MADGTVFGLIHDLKDRRRARQVRDARRNYLSDPLGTIQQVHEIDPDVGLALRNDYQNVLKERQAGQEAAAKAARERALGAARNLTQGLMRVRDSGGDIATAFEESVPILRNGFEMNDDEINQWRERITTNPASLDMIHKMLVEPTDAETKLYDLAPGAKLVDYRGTEIASAPALPKTVTMRGGDGSEHLYVIDENGNLVQGGAASGAPGPASVPGAQGGSQPRGIRNFNPGNIKDGPWAQRQPGYAGSDGTFARFASMEAGTAAQERLLGSHYVNGQRSVRDIVMKYLGGANNPENSAESQQNYVRYVAERLGLDPTAPVPPAMLQDLGQAMREFENGQQVNRGGSGLPGRPIASTPGKPPEPPKGWRNMTEQEKIQAGLDPGRAYQIGISGENTGKIQQISGQPSPGKGPNGGDPGKILAQHHSALTSAERVRDEARMLRRHPAFDQATGAVQGRLPSVMPQTVDFDDRLDAFVSNTVVDALLKMKQNSPNGATGFGQLNMQEGNWIKQAEGSFKQTSPEALRDSLTRHERDAMITIGMIYNIPPEATQLLLQNPKLAPQFNEKYGAGMAEKIMGD